MAKEYNFQYTPLTGRLPGNSFVKQTEQAINELAGIVNEGSAQVEVITNLANTANDNSEEALEKANEALETESRVYITLPNLDDADSYFDSQLYYFANSYSHNLPVQGTGFLEVKTNDTKTACEQVFIADLTGLCYFRHGTITSAEVGSETVYSATWDIWSSELASEDYVQGELLNYLPLSGGTLTGVVNGVTPTAGDDTTKLATTAYVQEEIRQHGNLPVGHEYFSMNPNIPQGSLPLIGGVYSRETYADLWEWVQTQSGYLKTEAEWQTLSASNNGNVPYYSDGDGSTTFRVPSLKCWIKGANGTVSEVGSYLAAGLPNITGAVTIYTTASNGGQFYGEVKNASGAFAAGVDYSQSTGASYSGITAKSIKTAINLNASNSNAIYGNSTTVQPESIVGLWLVKAYGTVVDTGTIDEQAYIDEQLAINVPAGCVQAFAGNATPQGWLLCDGSAVSRTQYSRLFGVIGTTYGAGDGTDTFNLPNLVDKFVEGSATAGTVKSAGLPNIVGQAYTTYGVIRPIPSAPTGAFTGSTSEIGSNPTTSPMFPQTVSVGEITFDASNSNSIYGNSTTVQPPALTMKYIIKY